MQSSLIDERLAGNYRASVQAQMNAEKALAKSVGKLVSGSKPNCEESRWQEYIKNSSDKHVFKNFECTSVIDKRDVCGDVENRCLLFSISVGNPGNEYMVVGGVASGNDIIAKSLPIFIEYDSKCSGGRIPFNEDIPIELSLAAIVSAAEIAFPPSNITGGIEKNYGHASEDSVPDPRDWYVAAVNEYFEGEEFESNGCAEKCGVVFCSKSKGFEGKNKNPEIDVSDYEEVALFVFDVPEGVTVNVGEGMGKVKASFVSSGAITINGASNTQVTGLIWSAGSMSINGGRGGSFSVEGSMVAGGPISFNGVASVIFSDESDSITGPNNKPGENINGVPEWNIIYP